MSQKQKLPQIGVTTDDFYDLYGVIGMKISSDGQSIWFCSSPLPQMEGYEEGGQYTPSVFRVNLSDKTMVDRFALPIGSVPGDLVLGLILNDEFYFVSNSPWSYYEGNDMLVEKIKKPQIRENKTSRLVNYDQKWNQIKPGVFTRST